MQWHLNVNAARFPMIPVDLPVRFSGHKSEIRTNVICGFIIIYVLPSSVSHRNKYQISLRELCAMQSVLEAAAWLVA